MKRMLKFLPLLIIYILMILFLSREGEGHDEGRYLLHAENLLNGFYTDAENPYLLTGPGYPIFLAAFLGLDLPPIVPKLANGFLVFFAVLFLYKTLRIFVSERVAIVVAYIMGLYWPMYKWMIFRITDFLALFLISAFIYFTIKLLRSEKIKLKNTILPSAFLAYLILTKVFFGYLVLACLGLTVFYYQVYRDRKGLKLVLVMSFAWLLGAVPYLGYTYSLTGKIFYWGTNGGEQMYWMSSHLKSEYGNWIPHPLVLQELIPGMDPKHKIFFDSAFTKPHVERNDLFLNTAKERIKKDPFGYIYNVIASSLRLAFHFPYSYQYQSLSPYPRIFHHMMLIVPLLLSLIPAWLHRKNLPMEIICMGLFITIYWGMISLITGMPRHFIPMLPFILIWLAFIYTYFVQISFKNTFSEN